MPTEPARPLLRLARLAPPTDGDAVLLARFAATRCEDAFAELVRRHGPVVLGVCRRVCGCRHTADDAFQAAFLVLARRAHQVGRPELLANWLYGVAVRTAKEAAAARRRAGGQPMSAIPEPAARPAADDDQPDLRAVLDDELARLPDKYRAAVVLCELDGLSRKTAADRLGIPEGTLSSRLAHARKLLADRLRRRGVTAGLTAGLTAGMLLGESARAVVPPGLADGVMKVVGGWAAGGAVPPEVLSPAVSSLSDKVVTLMIVHRLTTVFGAGLLACGLVGLAAGVGIGQRPGAPVADPTDPPQPPPATRIDPPLAAPRPATAPRAQPQPTDKTKVAAKGIEDDEVPYPTLPTQAVVRIDDDGQLVIRRRTAYYEPVTDDSRPGQRVTRYGMRSGVPAVKTDAADVVAFDGKGNRLATKVWKDKLKTDVHALIAADGKLPHPRELALFRDDVLILVLPARPTPEPTTTEQKQNGVRYRTVRDPETGRTVTYAEVVAEDVADAPSPVRGVQPVYVPVTPSYVPSAFAPPVPTVPAGGDLLPPRADHPQPARDPNIPPPSVRPVRPAPPAPASLPPTQPRRTTPPAAPRVELPTVPPAPPAPAALPPTVPDVPGVEELPVLPPPSPDVPATVPPPAAQVLPPTVPISPNGPNV